ncbi:hypothetical protein [Capnocytophaga canimorsus]|uniref:hypothetical protein n=1 Tax=Capnocytophaga canimorsus TaxID=28188 RepID=UPI00385B097F
MIKWILFLLFSTPLFAQKLTDRESVFFLKGKVKEMRVIPYDIKEENEEIIEKKHSQGFLNDNNIAVQFNPEGQAVEQVLYDSDNSVISKALFFYSNTRKIKEEHYDKTGMLTEIYLITYDDTKKEKQNTRYPFGSQKSTQNVICQIDENDNHIQCTVYSAEQIVKNTSYFLYNKAGQILQKAYRDSQERLYLQIDYLYDSRGNLIEILQEDYDDFRKNFKINFQYNEKDECIEQVIGGNGKLPARSHFTYEYDSQGNWIQKKVNYKGKFVFLVERKITYY